MRLHSELLCDHQPQLANRVMKGDILQLQLPEDCVAYLHQYLIVPIVVVYRANVKFGPPLVVVTHGQFIFHPLRLCYVPYDRTVVPVRSPV